MGNAATLIKALDAPCEVKLDLLVKDYNALADLYASLEAENRRLVEAILWACGEGPEPFWSEPERVERGLPRYWWRKGLRAALAAHDQGGGGL